MPSCRFEIWWNTDSSIVLNIALRFWRFLVLLFYISIR
jgi:hypothetical protein